MLVAVISVVEMWLLIEVSARLGLAWTIAGCVLTGVVGGALVRQEGIKTLMDIQRVAAQGRVPAQELVAGAMLFAVGALLVTPGFVTDSLGFLVLVPGIRRSLAAYLLDWFAARPKKVHAGEVVIEAQARNPTSDQPLIHNEDDKS